MVNISIDDLWCKNNAIDGCAGAFYYLSQPEEFQPVMAVPTYALVVLSLKRNIGSFVFISKHHYVNGEWIIPITLGGKYYEFVPDRLSDVYTLDKTLQVRPSECMDTVLLGKDIKTEETIRLIKDFDSGICELHIEALKLDKL